MLLAITSHAFNIFFILLHHPFFLSRSILTVLLTLYFLVLWSRMLRTALLQRCFFCFTTVLVIITSLPVSMTTSSSSFSPKTERNILGTPGLSRGGGSCRSMREQKIASLIDSYKRKYNDNTCFHVHPAISFVASEHGISVKVKANAAIIPKGTALMMVPHEERVSVVNALASTSARSSNSSSSPGKQSLLLRFILQDTQKAYDSVANVLVSGEYRLQHIFKYGDIALAVTIMYLKGVVGTDDGNYGPPGCLLSKVVDTWPTLLEFRQSCANIWEPSNSRGSAGASNPEQDTDAWHLLRGTDPGENLRMSYEGYKFIFQEIIRPVLFRRKIIDWFLPMVNKSDYNDEDKALKPKEGRLWDAYLHASYALRSRAHGGRQPLEPEIIPLVDMLNGFPEDCGPNKFNVALSSTSSSSSDMARSVITSTRDIAPDEELILSYGDHTATVFISQHGFCPHEMLGNPAVDTVTLRIPPSLGPPDELRAWACRSLNFPSTPEEIDRFMCQLPNGSLGPFSERMQACTPGIPPTDDIFALYYTRLPQLKMFHQYLVLCHVASDDEVRNAVSSSRINISLNEFRISQMFQLIVDHVLEHATDLASSTNEHDLEMASAPTTPHDMVAAYRARVYQRDALAQWRHAFCQRHGFPSQHSDATYSRYVNDDSHNDRLFCPQLPRPQAPQCLLESRGCHFCGRTLQLNTCGKLLQCSKCKVTKYCSTEHQRLDWKWHKHSCDSSS